MQGSEGIADRPRASSVREQTARRFGSRALSAAAVACFLLYISVDLVLAARHVALAAAPATIGFILLSSVVLSGGAALVLGAAIVLARYMPRTITRVLGACVIAFYPARWLATALTSGSGIARSGWASAVSGAVVVGLLVTAAAAAGLLPAAHGWLSRRGRLIVGGLIVALGIVAIGVTSFHSTTYLRAHRGILVVSALLLELGILFMFPGGDQEPTRRRAHVLLPAGIGALVISSFILTRIGGAQRALASHTVFSHTLVAQKLQAVLLRLSPVFHATARVSLDATRLAPNNPTPVSPLPRGRFRGSNVLFVTFDALRGDAVSRSVGGKSIAPTLKALASEGTVFTNAIVNYSHTSRSLFSVLAASWEISFPSETYVSTDAKDVLDRTRLPRLLHRAGYEAVAIMMSGRWGEVFFDRHRFPEFDQHIGAGEHCEQQVEAFRRYVAQRTASRPFWAWVHIFDTHTPFEGAGADSQFGTSPTGHYADAVHRGDRCLGELIGALHDANEWKRTVVVVSGDHGEAIGEHGRLFQHSTCYWHDIHVPLVVRLPGLRGPRSVDYPIQHADLVPTLANLLGVRLHEPGIDGDDLSGLLEGTSAASRVSAPAAMAFTQGHLEQYRCSSVVSDNWHLIYTDASRTYELYDVEADPREENNLIGERPDILEALQPVLDTFRERAAGVVTR